jgi:hypothetical protein
VRSGHGSTGAGILCRAGAIWIVLIGAEVSHGIARAMWLVPQVGDFRSSQIGVFTVGENSVKFPAFSQGELPF